MSYSRAQPASRRRQYSKLIFKQLDHLIYGVPGDEGPGLPAVLFYYGAAHEKNNFLSAHPQNKISID